MDILRLSSRFFPPSLFFLDRSVRLFFAGNEMNSLVATPNENVPLARHKIFKLNTRKTAPSPLRECVCLCVGVFVHGDPSEIVIEHVLLLSREMSQLKCISTMFHIHSFHLISTRDIRAFLVFGANRLAAFATMDITHIYKEISLAYTSTPCFTFGIIFFFSSLPFSTSD